MWETFIEDIVDEGQEFLLIHVSDPTKLGYEVLLPVSEDLKTRKDIRKIWGIAGDAWKIRLRERRRQLLDGFHTPRPDNVDELVLQTLGIKRISTKWQWAEGTQCQGHPRLNALVTMRGAIAHDLLSVPKVNFQTFMSQLSFTRFVCTITANEVRKHIHAITGLYPWEHI